MARLIREIQSEIETNILAAMPSMSISATAQWRQIAHVVAMAIHTFEIILDRFRAETEGKLNMMTPGTERWYSEMCLRFQYGHQLIFDPQTAMFRYETVDPAARIINIVAVTNRAGRLVIKVAKTDDTGKVVHLDRDELESFTGYIRQISMFGVTNLITSTTPDQIKYNIEVFCGDTFLSSEVEKSVKAAIEDFKSQISFDGLFYPQKFIDYIMHCPGVLTVKVISFQRKGSGDADFVNVDAWSELVAGYFDYTSDSVLTIKKIQNEI